MGWARVVPAEFPHHVLFVRGEPPLLIEKGVGSALGDHGRLVFQGGEHQGMRAPVHLAVRTRGEGKVDLYEPPPGFGLELGDDRCVAPQ